MRKLQTVSGVLVLLAACVLWGASFPIIKVVMSFTDLGNYLWLRGSIAVAVLLPLILPRLTKGRVPRSCVVGGLITGVSYCSGLALQAVGVALTSASRAAFLTGFSTVFVHLYTSAIERRYSKELGIALAMSMAGLYLMTKPSGGLLLGDIFVILSAVAWSVQIVLVSRYSHCDPLTFVFFENVPLLAFLPTSVALGRLVYALPPEILGYIAVLSIGCSIIAFALQVVGQRLVDPATASILYQTEPVFATAIAYALLGETMKGLEAVGAGLILAATMIAAYGCSKISYPSYRS